MAFICVFNHKSIPPPQFLSEKHLKDLILLCTTQTSFMTPDNIMYHQIDVNIIKGSPWGSLYANYYMCHIENNVLPTMHSPPILYFRYVDDTFYWLTTKKQLKNIVQIFRNNSVLNLTSELEKTTANKIHDITIKKENNNINF